MELSPVGCGAFVFAKKVAGLREHVQRWAKLSFACIKLKKLALLHEDEMLDIAKETRCLTLSKSRQEQAFFENLGEIHKQEEIYWR